MMRLGEGARILGSGLLDLVLAPACPACRGPAAPGRGGICPGCRSRLRSLPVPRCHRCWTPLLPGSGREAGCRTCADLPDALRAVRSAVVMEGPARRLVHALKYGGWRFLAAELADRMAEVELPADVRAEAEVVVPVPAAPVRLRERGYNQAGLLAEELADRLGLAVVPDRLTRVRAARRQTGLHPSERRGNVAGAFVAGPTRPTGPIGEHLILVDDVWTTGATAVACVDALVAAGVRTVTVITFARALAERRPG